MYDKKVQDRINELETKIATLNNECYDKRIEHKQVKVNLALIASLEGELKMLRIEHYLGVIKQ